MRIEAHRRLYRAFTLVGTCILGLSVLFWMTTPRTPVQAASPDTYLSHPDLVCRSCHQKIYDRYEKTPMALGSGLAVDGLDAMELTAKDLVHRTSGVSYHVFVRDGQAYLAYSRPSSPGRNALSGERRLSFFVGSGRRGRTYLYDQNGLWFEAPINWYGKTQMWDMAPAFDDVRAMPDPLPVDSNCLHCHTGDVQPAMGPVRNRYAAQPFRSSGVGCAACHGDPAAHLDQTRNLNNARGQGTSKFQRAQAASAASSLIVNPSKLDPGRRDSVCLQCHLEGDAVVYLPGKSLQAFKPGEELSASVTYFIDRNRPQFGLRATSQYEALLRSACKRASGDRLTCTTCHDPHGSPSPVERVAYFRARCLSCHTGDAIAIKHHPEQQDCAACHMPTRKTADISHEQLTDHDIEALPRNALPSLPGAASRQAAELVPIGIGKPSDRELGLAYAQLAQRGDRTSGQRALSLLQSAEGSGSRDNEVLNQLAFLLQISGSTKAAAGFYLEALRQSPLDIRASANLAVIDAAAEKQAEAIGLLTRVIQDDPSQTVAGLNLAFLECRAGRKVEALHVIQLMLQYNPDSPAAHRFLDSGRYGSQTCTVQ